MTDFKNKIINMKVISKLQPHVRLDTSAKLFKVYQPMYAVPSWVQRWWANHNRTQDIARITILYADAVKLLSALEEQDKKEQLIKALTDSIPGLNNLKTTYEEDITCVSSVEYIIEQINLTISTG